MRPQKPGFQLWRRSLAPSSYSACSTSSSAIQSSGSESSSAPWKQPRSRSSRLVEGSGCSSAMTIGSNEGHEAMNTQQATELQLRQLINLLRRRWKLIMAAGVIAVGLAGTIGLVIPPRYTATAQV